MIHKNVFLPQKQKVKLFYFLVLFGFVGNTQILINEASNKNSTQIFDEDNDNEDWVELFNTSQNIVNIENWTITDNLDKPTKWSFPNLELAPKSHLIVFASGKDRGTNLHGAKWGSAILPENTFNYHVPNNNTPSNWNTLNYNVSDWTTGRAGFGYGDDDDVTVVLEGSSTIYIRKSFTITNLDEIVTAICNVDYDDGFVAYINGIEICRNNISGTPLWNTLADKNHEALIVNGMKPEEYIIDHDLLESSLVQGENLFAIEVHNVNYDSSDLSIIPFLSFSYNSENDYFSQTPLWFDINNETPELHTNFKISGEGETIYLYDNNQLFIDSMVVDVKNINYSYGREKDGTDKFAIFQTATPKKTNNNALAFTEGYEETPSFNIPAGYYNNTLNISINTTSDSAQIRYTLDGSEPTINSKLYNGTSIILNKSTSVNVKSFSSTNKLPSLVNTNTYIINEKFSVPVLSITTDEKNLFGDDGIFTNHDKEWNKPCYIEYFESNGTLAFSQKSGIQVDGGAGGSRSKPQTSFRIEPGNGTYGDGDLNYNFHPNRPNRTNYSSLYLRNGSNRYLDLQYKDAAQVRGMGQNTHNFYSEYRPIVVYINGEYYGLYEGREKINEDYLKNNYNIDTSNMDMVGISHFKNPRTILPIIGSSDPFFEDYENFLTMNPSSEDYLTKVSAILDLDNYTDYIAAQTWMTNKDWPHNNMKAWRCEGTEMRWQFALIDLEWSFLPTNTNAKLSTLPNFDQIEYMNSNGTDWPASGYWFKLMQNNDYKNLFINRLCDLMNTSYDAEILVETETEIFNEVLPETEKYYDKWNGDFSNFESNHNDFNNQLRIREAYLRDHLRDHYKLNNNVEVNLNVKGFGKTKISTIVPNNYPWKGDYFSNTPITLEAIPSPGYKFVAWEDNGLVENLNKDKITLELGNNNSVNFVAIFEEDTDIPNRITISEINYKDGENFNTIDWFEIYNGTNNTINIENWYFTDSKPSHRFDFNTKTEIKSGEYIVITRDLDEFSEIYPNTSNVIGDFDFGLGSTDEINIYNANDELIIKVEYSDEAPWPLNGDETGKTLELAFYNSDQLSDPLVWTKGCIKGTPGASYNKDCGNLSTPDSNTYTGIKAYPIPAKNEVQISFNLKTSEHSISMEIYDSFGKMIQKNHISDLNTGENLVNLNISQLQAGLYMLVFHTTKKVEIVKIIKI